MNAKSA
jgi:hypothetical protein